MAERHGLMITSAGGSARFCETVERALQLIRDHDPRRYLRVTNSADWIVDYVAPFGSGGGVYRSAIRSIELDVDYNLVDSEAALAAQVASVIVHEATHGELRRRGFPYTDVNWKQCERICVAEENRFLLKLRRSGLEFPDWLIEEFAPERWDLFRESSRWKRLWCTLRRITQKHLEV